MIPQEPTATVAPVSSKRSLILVTITVLLIVSVLTNMVQLAVTFQQNQIAAQRASTYQQRVEEAEKVVASQQTIITNLMDNYKETAYGNPDVTRIAEQQLMATETSLTALQIIAIQNTSHLTFLTRAGWLSSNKEYI